jgi:hypothetical protein
MAKLTLADLASLANQTTAINTINANNALIETALENTLSRDGTSPNAMGANLDMNSNRILNLPTPDADTEPMRKGDVEELSNFTSLLASQILVVPTGDIDSTDVQEALEEIAAKVPFISVKEYGAVGDGVTDDTEAFQTAAAAFGGTEGPFAEANGGILWVPKGVYLVNEQILFECPGIRVKGDGLESTKIYVNGNLGVNAAVFKFKQTNNEYSNVAVSVEDMYISLEGNTGHGIWMMKPYDGSTLKNLIIANVADGNNAYRIEPDPDSVSDDVSQNLVCENIWGWHLNDTATAPLFYGERMQECVFTLSKMAGDTIADTSPCHPWHFVDCRGLTFNCCTAQNAENHGWLLEAVESDADTFVFNGCTWETIDGAIKTAVTGAFRVKGIVVVGPRWEGAVSHAAGVFDLNGATEAVIEARAKTVNVDGNSSFYQILTDSSGNVTTVGAGNYIGYSWQGGMFLPSGAIFNWNAGDVTLTHSSNALTIAGGSLVLPAAGLTVGASIPFSDAAGTLTLQNVDALDATTEATIEAAIDTLGALSITGTLSFPTGHIVSWNAGEITLTHSTNMLTVNGASLVWNEAGADLDIRFEGDTDANLFFLDASTDRIGLGTSTPAVKLHVTGTSTVAMRLVNTAASGAAAGAFMTAISDDGAALGSGDRLGGFVLGGASDASSTIGLQTGFTGWAAENWSGGAAGAYLTLETTAIGSITRTERMRIDPNGLVIHTPITTTPATLGTNGQWTMTPTSNTNMRISYRGSDGTTRVGNITLA